MDEFAQSREDDDLFADEFEPVGELAVTGDEQTPTAINPQTNTDSTKVSVSVSSPPAAASSLRNGARESRDRRGRGGRGGRGVAGGRENGIISSRYATKADSTPTSAEESIAPPQANVPIPTSTSALTDSPAATQPTQPTLPPEPTPTQIRTPAVRGDRSLTGGPTKKKLTDAELTEKLAQMAILNAEKSKKHQAQEADQAAFDQRSAALAKERAEKAKEERKNERVMEMERARNRERKMKAQGGREWDSEKVEPDIVDERGKGRSSAYVRGGHGGVIKGGLAGSRYSIADEDATEPRQASTARGGFEIRGRGVRGGRNGRGRRAAALEDFPALPVTAKSTISLEPAAPIENKSPEEKVKSSESEKPAGDWAEEMATPVEEKKMEV